MEGNHDGGEDLEADELRGEVGQSVALLGLVTLLVMVCMVIGLAL
jgi:hypothetical protein